MTPRHVWRDPSLRPVVAASLTLSLAIGVFGVSFGVGAVSAGASVAQACVMSLLVFTGERARQLGAEDRMIGDICGQGGVPFLFGLGAGLDRGAEEIERIVGNEESRFLRPGKVLLGGEHLVRTKG